MKGAPVVALVAGGAVLVLGAVALAATDSQSAAGGVAGPRDVEALARMLASENPSGSLRLWVEQCWTQIASRRRGQSIYDRITGGSGFGPQNKQRPVSTDQPAGDTHRIVARLVLLGAELAALPGARKFFEPEQQDLMFAQAERARAKRARGEQLTAKELRALKYEHDAGSLRRKWSQEGARFVGVVDGVEFWT